MGSDPESVLLRGKNISHKKVLFLQRQKDSNFSAVKVIGHYLRVN